MTNIEIKIKKTVKESPDNGMFGTRGRVITNEEHDVGVRMKAQFTTTVAAKGHDAYQSLLSGGQIFIEELNQRIDMAGNRKSDRYSPGSGSVEFKNSLEGGVLSLFDGC